jgi:hypothetical protein
MPHKSRRRVNQSHVNLREPNVVLSEVEYIVGRATHLEARIVTLAHLIFFSTETGDAWVLDPEDGFALPLAADGSRLSFQIIETVTTFVINWTASYQLDGDSFVVTDASRQRVIYGYPAQELAEAQQRARQ